MVRVVQKVHTYTQCKHTNNCTHTSTHAHARTHTHTHHLLCRLFRFHISLVMSGFAQDQVIDSLSQFRNLRMYVCKHVCMYVCAYVCTYIHTHVQWLLGQRGKVKLYVIRSMWYSECIESADPKTYHLFSFLQLFLLFRLSILNATAEH